MTLVFVASKPGLLWRDDIGAILTALTIRRDEPAYLDALRAAARAMGLNEVPGTVAQHYGPVRYDPDYTAVVEVVTP